MIIQNGNIFQEEGKFAVGSVRLEGASIAEVMLQEKCTLETGREEVIDATDLYVIPGLTDIHFHGCVGHDFCEGTTEALEEMAKFQLSKGVTTICPASMSYDEERLTRIFQTAAAYENKQGAELVGINMEGPFISYEKKGAQNPEYILPPSAEMFLRLQKAAGGLIKLVDMAPEQEGAMDCIAEIAGDVHVSLAHTTADYETAMEAFGLGADHVTHLFNGMTEFHYRKPGVLGAVSDRENVYAEIIGDGIHVHGATIRMMLKMLGSDRVVLISDSMEACGMPDGEYSLGGLAVTVKGNRATLHDGTIAGSATSLMDCVRVLVGQMEIPLGIAVKLAAVNSAKSIGIFDTYGSIREGKRGNLVLLDRDLQIKYVIQNGSVQHRF